MGLRLVSAFTNEPTTGIQKGSHLRYEQLVSFIIVCSIFLVTSTIISAFLNKYGSQEWKWKARNRFFSDESFGPLATPSQRHEQDTADTNTIHRSQ